MVKEEGFTLQKYEELFFSTMDEEDLEEWADRLPDHPKLPGAEKKKKKQQNGTKKYCVSISSSDDAASSSEGEGGNYELIRGRGRSSGGKYTTLWCVWYPKR